MSETMSAEVIDEYKFDETTGELIVPADEKEYELIKSSKINMYKLLKPEDFVNINGTWEAKADALKKILSSCPFGYDWRHRDREINKDYVLVSGTLVIKINEVERNIDAMGVVEPDEMKGKPLHFLLAKAETRALKRAIDVALGSVVNAYVIKVLQPLQQQRIYK